MGDAAARPDHYDSLADRLDDRWEKTLDCRFNHDADSLHEHPREPQLVGYGEGGAVSGVYFDDISLIDEISKNRPDWAATAAGRPCLLKTLLGSHREPYSGLRAGAGTDSAVKFIVNRFACTVAVALAPTAAALRPPLGAQYDQNWRLGKDSEAVHLFVGESL